MNKVQEELICSICLENYKNPKILPCFHTFCETCIDKVISTTTPTPSHINCPTCRKIIPIDRGGASSLPSDLLRKRLLEIVLTEEREQNKKRRVSQTLLNDALCEQLEQTPAAISAVHTAIKRVKDMMGKVKTQAEDIQKTISKEIQEHIQEFYNREKMLIEQTQKIKEEKEVIFTIKLKQLNDMLVTLQQTMSLIQKSASSEEAAQDQTLRKEIEEGLKVLKQHQFDAEFDLQDEELIKTEFKTIKPEIYKFGSILSRKSDLVKNLAETDESKISIFVIGGTNGKGELNNVDRFDYSFTSWLPTTPMNAKRLGASAVNFEKDSIFVIGGKSIKCDLSTIERYDCRYDTWTMLSKPSLNQRRSYLTAAALDNSIYIIGGRELTSITSLVERFDPYRCSITTIGSTPHRPRSGLASVAVNNAIYILGGWSKDRCLSSVERFDPREGEFTLVASMKEKRNVLSAVTLNGNIYAIGGHTGLCSLNSCERYDSRMDIWLPIASMNQPRYSHATVTYENTIITLGGHETKDTPLSVVERYHPAADDWSGFISMPTPRAGLCSVVAAHLQ